MSKGQPISRVSQVFIPALLAIMLWQLIIIPLEHLTTEVNLIYLTIPSNLKTAILIASIVLVGIIWPAIEKRLLNLSSKLLTIVFSVAFVFTLVLTNRYATYHQQLQQFPRIYSKKPDWTIQGSQIKLEGKNFGPSHLAGQVLLNNHQLTIQKWSDKTILVQQPVLGEFGSVELVVINHLNNQSNKVQHFIKDPAEL